MYYYDYYVAPRCRRISASTSPYSVLSLSPFSPASLMPSLTHSHNRELLQIKPLHVSQQSLIERRFKKKKKKKGLCLCVCVCVLVFNRVISNVDTHIHRCEHIEGAPAPRLRVYLKTGAAVATVPIKQMERS